MLKIHHNVWQLITLTDFSGGLSLSGNNFGIKFRALLANIRSGDRRVVYAPFELQLVNVNHKANKNSRGGIQTQRTISRQT